jgi:hypothetical protein
MGKQRPEHRQEPAEDAEDDVETPGVQRLGDPANPGATERANTGKQPRQHSQEARSIVQATCSHPRAEGDKGLSRVTSSRWERSFFTGSGFPLTNFPCAR